MWVSTVPGAMNVGYYLSKLVGNMREAKRGHFFVSAARAEVVKGALG